MASAYPPDTSPLSLWIKPEPFTFGALPVPPHPRLSVHVSVMPKTRFCLNRRAYGNKVNSLYFVCVFFFFRTSKRS